MHLPISLRNWDQNMHSTWLDKITSIDNVHKRLHEYQRMKTLIKNSGSKSRYTCSDTAVCLVWKQRKYQFLYNHFSKAQPCGYFLMKLISDINCIIYILILDSRFALCHQSITHFNHTSNAHFDNSTRPCSYKKRAMEPINSLYNTQLSIDTGVESE